MTTNTIPADADPRVNHPPHYNQGRVEAIDLMEARFPSEPHLFTALKYILRAPHKGAEKEDYRKAAWYVRRRLMDPTPLVYLNIRLQHGIPLMDKRSPTLGLLVYSRLDRPMLECVAGFLEALARE